MRNATSFGCVVSVLRSSSGLWFVYWDTPHQKKSHAMDVKIKIIVRNRGRETFSRWPFCIW